MSGPTAKSVSDLQEEINLLDPHYRVEKVIGSGSYGIVMRAVDTRSNDTVAIKRINKEIFEEVILAKRILREVKLLAHFNDANIVRLRNLLTPPTEQFDVLFIVMDFMETDLRAVLRSGQKLSDSHTQFFMYQALRAMKVIHSASVIHRDVTPANILVNTNCDLKICDFGLSKEETEDENGEMTDYVTMRWYRAPELVMEHRHYGGKVDVWGIGLIMGELLGSRPLCQGRDRVLQLDRIVELIGTPTEDEINSLGSAAAQKYLKKKTGRPSIDWAAKYPEASPMAIDLLKRMLVFHPDKRISIDDALRHPYFASIFDEADVDKVKVAKFTFDETEHQTLGEVKRALFVETKLHNSRQPIKPVAVPLAAAAAPAGSPGKDAAASA
jgi:mitogen-activated protein kinase 1/3